MQKLVREENVDRKALFESLAKKTGGSKLDVASKFSIGLAKKAKKDTGLRRQTGIGFENKVYFHSTCFFGCAVWVRMQSS